jgi:hypothetical protein
VPPLADAVRRTWSQWPTAPAVEPAVFGTADAGEVAAAVWLACSCARCEHSIGRHDGIYLTALRRWGDDYLAIGR